MNNCQNCQNCQNRIFAIFIQAFTQIVIYVLIFSSGHALAEPGGYFEKDFANKGFFSPSEIATPRALPTERPTPKTVTEQPIVQPKKVELPTDTRTISNADIARGLIYGGSEAINSVKGIQSDPARAEQLMNTINGTKESLSRQLGISQHSVVGAGSAVSVNGNLVVPENLMDDYSDKNDPVSITVIVKAEPRATFLRTIDRMVIAATTLKVKLNKFYIIGTNKDSQSFILDREYSIKKLKKLFYSVKVSPEQQQAIFSAIEKSLPNSQALLEKLYFKRIDSHQIAESLLKEHNIDSSPAWIVEASGKKTVLQGEVDPREFLTDKGQLVPDLYENLLGGAPFGMMKGKGENQVIEFEIVERKEKKSSSNLIANCTRSRIRRLEVGPASMGSFFSPEMVIYSPEDPKQTGASQQYGGVTVPYYQSPGVHQDASPLLPFIETLPLRCLPTKFNFTTVGSRQFMELRQGDAAWKN